MKKLNLILLVFGIIIIGGILLSGDDINFSKMFESKSKYEVCIEACEENGECAEYIGIPANPNGLSSSSIRCSKWSSVDCNNICVEKYK